MLRTWQVQCLSQTITSYRKQSQFLVLASPGAGKTLLAANFFITIPRNSSSFSKVDKEFVQSILELFKLMYSFTADGSLRRYGFYR